MKRLFVAVIPPEEIRAKIKRLQSHLREVIGTEGIRWTLPEQFHYTLKFLGDVEDSELPAVIAGVERAAMRSATGPLDVAELGVFPAQRSPQVLWMGATDGVPVLRQTAQYMNEELAKQGFPTETKSYIPHLTLARMKTREGEEMVAKNLSMLQNEPEFRGTLGTFLMQGCALMQSELRPEGAAHTLIKSFAFALHSEYNR